MSVCDFLSPFADLDHAVIAKIPVLQNTVYFVHTMPPSFLSRNLVLTTYFIFKKPSKCWILSS